MTSYGDNKQALLARLHRIEGQVRGITRMVEEDRYCVEILDQISAVNRATQAVALALLDDHLAHCVADATSTSEAEEHLARASAAIARLVRA